jgi:GTPase SAR1 family protein
MNDNYFVKLIIYARKQKNRERIKQLYESGKLYIDNYYLPVFKKLFEIQEDLSRSELKDIISLLPDSTRILNNLNDTVTDTVAEFIIKELVAYNCYVKLTSIMQSADNLLSKIDKIKKTINNYHITDSNCLVQRKLSSELKITEDNSLFEFVYKISRGELIGLFGYTGIGKTTLCLSLIRYLSENNIKCHFISIQDWTENSLARKIKDTNLPEFIVSIYSDADINVIEEDISKSIADVIFIDSMTNIYTDISKERYLQLKYIAENLKKYAVKYDKVIITTHQLNRNSQYPSVTDIQDSHSHILADFDIVFGIGRENDEINLTTLKVRHHEAIDLVSFKLDYKNIKIQEEI